MSGELILAFFLVRYMHRSLPDTSPLRKWDQVIKAGTYSLLVLFAIAIFTNLPPLFNWVEHIILLAIIYAIYKLPDLKLFKNIIMAVLPLLIVTVSKDLVAFFISEGKARSLLYYNIAFPCALAWMIGVFIILNKQQKARLKDWQIREQEEEKNRIIAARKAELEEMVVARTAELSAQKQELEHALSELRDTQVQLIQSEKMASLGELTAGIAHEIQNPLNFVNNFSEINAELIEELEHEINQGNLDEVKYIAGNIKDNEQKINHHGKRADAIVKGMLEHSRNNSGKKELTDINALADEYLRLSYHGLRAKDKLFNATFKTDFDPGIGKMQVVPQDIGRVFLNLYNNAFYSVAQKKRQTIAGYDPIVWVTTKKAEGEILIIVRDNGLGIPQKVIDKVFQPFFTTKPTGQGTGLGLSLSYDIIKAHGGELQVETKEGEFAEFRIELPGKEVV